MKTNKNGTFFTEEPRSLDAFKSGAVSSRDARPSEWPAARNVAKLIVSPRREHSRKPDEAYGRIQRLVSGPYLELFARQSRTGWDSIGDEAGLFDRGPVKTRNRPSNLKGATPAVIPLMT